MRKQLTPNGYYATDAEDCDLERGKLPACCCRSFAALHRVNAIPEEPISCSQHPHCLEDAFERLTGVPCTVYHTEGDHYVALPFGLPTKSLRAFCSWRAGTAEAASPVEAVRRLVAHLAIWQSFSGRSPQ